MNIIIIIFSLNHIHYNLIKNIYHSYDNWSQTPFKSNTYFILWGRGYATDRDRPYCPAATQVSLNLRKQNQSKIQSQIRLYVLMY